MKFLVMLAVLAGSLHAQSADTVSKLMDAPKPKLDKQTVSLWIETGAAHAADGYMIEKYCSDPDKSLCHEGVLPRAIWTRPWAMALTEAVMSGAQIVVSVHLQRHHRKWARAWDWSNALVFSGIDGYVASIIGDRQHPVSGAKHF